jgi:hypothetical protein
MSSLWPKVFPFVASSDKGDAMITQTEETVAWAYTALDKMMSTQSKWLWDEEYGMTSNAKDEHKEDQCDAPQEYVMQQQNT